MITKSQKKNLRSRISVLYAVKSELEDIEYELDTEICRLEMERTDDVEILEMKEKLDEFNTAIYSLQQAIDELESVWDLEELDE